MATAGARRVGVTGLLDTNRLKLPDAIVCATALEHQLELWTNDARLAKVSALVYRSVSIMV